MRHTGVVRHNIVEGEPGIFPDPVSRILRLPGRWLDRRSARRRAEQGDQADQPGEPDEPGESPARDEDGPEAPAPESTGDDHPST